MLRRTTSDYQLPLRNARRFFSLVPLMVFFMALLVLSSADKHSNAAGFLHLVLQSAIVALASSLISIAAYGLYRYLVDRSPGL